MAFEHEDHSRRKIDRCFGQAASQIETVAVLMRVGEDNFQHTYTVQRISKAGRKGQVNG